MDNILSFILVYAAMICFNKVLTKFINWGIKFVKKVIKNEKEPRPTDV